MEQIVIAGQQIGLTPMGKDELKGVFIDAILGYDFYKADFNGQRFCLLVSKREEKSTPTKYKQLSNRLEQLLACPIVFLFDRLEYYERNRLIGQGVFFVVSDKYVYLPYLIINAKDTDKKSTEVLNATSQFLLLYHLQINSISGLTTKEIEDLVPYKYVTLTRAITTLEDLHLCRSEKGADRQKRIFFDDVPALLWQKAQPYLNTPIKKVVYCDKIESLKLPICGINALSHSSNLNPETTAMYAMDESEFRTAELSGLFRNLNPIEGKTKIEVWKYPPIAVNNVVDKLSLFLTLKDDKDPRVEKELEIMISKLW